MSGNPSFENHLNAYNVVHLDLTTFREAEDVASEVTRVILADLREERPSVGMGNAGQPNELSSALADFAGATGVDLCS